MGGEGRRRNSRTSNSDAPGEGQVFVKESMQEYTPSSNGPIPEPGLKSRSSVLTMLPVITNEKWRPDPVAESLFSETNSDVSTRQSSEI